MVASSTEQRLGHLLDRASRYETLWWTLLVVGVGSLVITFMPGLATSTPAETSDVVTFGYEADVAPSPAYQSTEVQAPATLFRQQVDKMDVIYTYAGQPANIQASVELATSSGWVWKLPQEATATANGSLSGRIPLILSDLERKATKGTRAAGVEMSPISVVVALSITSADGGVFRPHLSMVLSSATMELDGGDQSLTQSQAVATQGDASVVTLAGVAIPSLLLRLLGGLLVVFASVILFGLWLEGRDPKSNSAEAKLASSHKSLFVEVGAFPPMVVPVVLVLSLDALIRIAERNACVILYVAQPSPVYRVQDETGVYQYTSQNLHVLELIKPR